MILSFGGHCGKRATPYSSEKLLLGPKHDIGQYHVEEVVLLPKATKQSASKF